MNNATDLDAAGLARKIAKVRSLVGRGERGEREAAEQVLSKMLTKLQAQFGVGDELAILDPVGTTTVDLGSARFWRRDCAIGAAHLGACYLTWTPGTGRVHFTGRTSGRTIAEFVVGHLMSSIDRACQAFVKDRRRRRRVCSRRNIEAFRKTAAKRLKERCADAMWEDPDWLKEVEGYRAKSKARAMAMPRVDRRLAGHRDGITSADRVPLSRPVGGVAVDRLAIGSGR